MPRSTRSMTSRSESGQGSSSSTWTRTRPSSATGRSPTLRLGWPTGIWERPSRCIRRRWISSATGRRSGTTSMSACTAPPCTRSSAASCLGFREGLATGNVLRGDDDTSSPLIEGAVTWSVGGKTDLPWFEGLTEREQRAGATFGVFPPGGYVVVHVDYARVVHMLPIGPERTRLTVSWLVPPNTVEHPGFSVEKADRAQRSRGSRGWPGQRDKPEGAALESAQVGGARTAGDLRARVSRLGQRTVERRWQRLRSRDDAIGGC